MHAYRKDTEYKELDTTNNILFSFVKSCYIGRQEITKRLRFVILFLVLALFFGFGLACTGPEPQVVEEPVVDEPVEEPTVDEPASVEPIEEFAEDEILWSEAKYHIGSRLTVYGPVIGTYYASTSKGQPTFLNIGKDYPDPERFTVFSSQLWLLSLPRCKRSL